MQNVIILHIETATKVCSVALSSNGKLIDHISDDHDNYTHAEKLTLFIKEIIERNNYTFEQLHAISVASGPGSYTGLRIGVSTAKGLCYALNTPLISVDALTSLTRQIKNPEANICAVIDARRMEVFSLIVDQEMNILKPISADIITAETYLSYEPFILIGDGAQKLIDLWENRASIKYDHSILSSATGQVKAAYSKYKISDFENLAYFEPFYLKDFKH